MKTIRVRLGARSYDIAGGPLGPSFARSLKKLDVGSTGILLVTSASVQKSGHARKAARALSSAGFRITTVVLPDGERFKTFKSLEKLYQQGFESRLDRHSAVVAIGGGVITDLAGFFAATYMRGIDFVSVPTTLLGMVDAAIGGKTSVDRPEGKNLVGAFWQPRLVWIDPGVLKTLPTKQWKTGFAEILKYGVIFDAAFFDWLENRIVRTPAFEHWPLADVEKAIRRSAEIKALVVSADEREKPLGGGREILNFGHTIGHALEAATGYSAFTHGQAISIGMCAAGRLALFHRMWSWPQQIRLENVLKRAGLPVRFPTLTASQRRRFWESLEKDKKNIGGKLRFVLPQKIGRVTVKNGLSPSLVAKIIREIS